MSYQIVIPARYQSTRLPGKPLADIAGKPMIVRVYERCCQTKADKVWVATDDSRIADVITQQGGHVVITRDDHPSGTDRLQEVVEKLSLNEQAVVVNVQGDEPMIPPAVIDQVASNLADNPAFDMATLCEPIEEIEDVFTPSVVKVVYAADGRALYFSRAPMPWHRDSFSTEKPQLSSASQWFRHIGLYAYRVGLLHRFVRWPVSPLEATESLEQLRALHHGVAIHVAPVCQSVPAGIDTQKDLQRVSAWLSQHEKNQ